MFLRIEQAGREASKLDEKQIAIEIGMEPAKLARVFNQTVGLTYNRCRRAFLMRKAAMDIASDHDHVRQIAYRLGYSDAANFDHDFRGFFGLTPTVFRRLQN